MTDYEMISTVTAGISLVIAIVAILVAGHANKKTEELGRDQLKLNHASVEMDLANQIAASKHRVEDFAAEHGDFLDREVTSLTSDEKKRRTRLTESCNAKVEGYLNALDAACQKYIDGKIDKARFQKSWQREFRQAVQNPVHQDFFPTGHAYNALMSVYDEWENPEKK